MAIMKICSKMAVKACLGVLCVNLGILLIGCSPGRNIVGGGGGSPTPTPGAARLLVSDNTTGTVNVIDAKTDLITKTIAAPSPGKMVSAGGTTVIQSTLASSISIFDNATETIRFTVTLPANPVDVAITPNGATAWVAENNGTVQSVNTATSAITATFTIAGVERLLIGPQGNTVLAFNDTLPIFLSIIVPGGLTGVGNPGLDHPTNAVFNGDDQNFILLSCGVECGGTQANFTGVALNTPGGPFISSPLALSAATVGLLSGTTLFVAGSPATGLNAGTLQVATLSTNAVGTPIHIADGHHSLMVLTPNGQLYIGATGCTLGTVNAQNQRQGCLTIFNTSTSTVTPVLVPALRINGDVTALAPVPGRNAIYVVQGGVVDIFDTTTNAVSTTAIAPTFPGTVFGVVQLNP
ncbi:MAG TPA: hypothetical protein VFB79_17460 [Candidatus Angelobacter sp.]|nr:hypothetical protein [Candidatus Angelobacter sp.]